MSIMRLPRLFAFATLAGAIVVAGVARPSAARPDRPAATPRPRRPAPSETVMVPMRDGTLLATEVHRPLAGAGPWPVQLERTPYGRGKGFDSETLRGYVTVKQDMRFTGDSRESPDKDKMIFFHDGWGEDQDGFDTVRWILAQPWCDGQVATVGSSAPGASQNLLAGATPPGLAGQFIGYAFSSMFHHAFWPGGASRDQLATGWILKFRQGLGALDTLKKHDTYDDFWKSVDTVSRAPEIDAPALHVGGWYDVFSQGTIDAFASRQYRGKAGAKGRQFLIMGPWTHGGERRATLGDYALPANSTMDFAPLKRAWMDFVLKGAKNEVAGWKAVRYYAIGDFGDPAAPGNVWKWADTWPVPHVKTTFFLAPNGRLAGQKPAIAAAMTYAFDPANPVPTRGGHNLRVDEGPRDQRPVEQRPDVLLFDSPPFREPTEVTGNVTAELWVSSDGPDTDFTVKLTDLRPDGQSVLLTDHILRMRYREGFEKKVWMQPGKVYPIAIELWAISKVFGTGHRLRLAVSSSNAPRFSVNPNTGPEAGNAKPRVAKNTLHVGGETPSRVIVPVVAGGAPAAPVAPPVKTATAPDSPETPVDDGEF
ncbi:MAG: CocE/NonD family hydrolase [Planctomycetes bacterium]|nr:CocE/NonD family hydrolase [Planctomycetota bacterium]